eukprot:37888-Eustigmatos_ZCMA.PRE.1
MEAMHVLGINFFGSTSSAHKAGVLLVLGLVSGVSLLSTGRARCGAVIASTAKNQRQAYKA